MGGRWGEVGEEGWEGGDDTTGPGLGGTLFIGQDWFYCGWAGGLDMIVMTILVLD